MNIRKIAVLALCALTLTACGDVNLIWSEEVVLSSSKTIVVKRGATGEKLGEIGGSGGWEQKEMWVEIKGEPLGVFTPPTWRTAYVPMLLDYDAEKSEWLIVATFYTCQGWTDLGKPKLPYVEYRVAEKSEWRVVPLESELYGRKANMLTGVRSGGEPSLVTVPDKTTRDRGAGESFRKIVSQWHSNNC